MISKPTLEDIVSLAKRRGFVFPGSEIYGGLANSWEYGPLGAELKKNIMDLWWKAFVRERQDMVGLDSSIILHPKTWYASGHAEGFSDAMVDCKQCKHRMRADHLIEHYFEKKGEHIQVEGKKEDELGTIIKENSILCPQCGKFDWTPVRKFNLLFETKIGIVADSESKAFLRGETAQGIFLAFKNIVDSMRVRLPFGVGQLGKSFRNEITPGNFIFRTLEFEQGEVEYFFDPQKTNWEAIFKEWKDVMWKFVVETLGVKEEDLRWREHGDEERSFYSKRTEDLEYHFPFGFKELWGIAYRTDYDLAQHEKYSGKELVIQDPETGEKIRPHVIEPAVGINRLLLMVLLDSYHEEGGDGDKRIVLKLKPNIAPYKVAVFPLLKNKPELVECARSIYRGLQKSMMVAWDERGNIGKRYYSQDEIGTPFCVTIDFQTLEDGSITVRDRDTMHQERISSDKLRDFLKEKGVC